MTATFDFNGGVARDMLGKILSPAPAQSLVMPPPDHAPESGPGESTPLSGNLAAPPTQANPSNEDERPRTGLAGYFARGPRAGQSNDQGEDQLYVKVLSHGQIGYLPQANLSRARQIDRDLKVLA